MDFLCYHRDRPESMHLRTETLEKHWSYMDRFTARMVARGPTFTRDGILTGSLHILDVPDASAARRFAFEEPGYQAGVYRDVLLRRWHNSLGRTMWDFDSDQAAGQSYLVLGFMFEPVTDVMEPPRHESLIAMGPLLSDDGSWRLGAAALVEASDEASARQILPPDQYAGVEVHHWRFGGRPT